MTDENITPEGDDAPADNAPPEAPAGGESEGESLLPPKQAYKAGDTMEDGSVLGENEADQLNIDEKLGDHADEKPLEIPDTYIRKTEDGEIDYKASLEATIEMHKNASDKLMQRKNRAPETIEGYKDVKVPEGLEVSEEQLQKFHDMDLSAPQVEGLMQELVDTYLPALNEKSRDLELSKLETMWGAAEDKAAFQAEMQKVGAFAIEKLGQEVAQRMAMTAEGFNAIREMMRAGVSDTSVNNLGDAASQDHSAEIAKLEKTYYDMSNSSKVRQAAWDKMVELEEKGLT